MSEDGGFLSRWSRRKADVKAGREAPLAPPPVERAPPVVVKAPVEPVATEPSPVATAEPAVPAPTLEDVRSLAPGDEVSRFVARGVDESVKRAAVKKLFADPHFNIMDGLDIYIDDYSQPDPLPMAMLRQLNQAKFMNLFAADEAAEAAAAAAASSDTQPAADPSPLAQDAGAASTEAAVPHAPDEDADLQLQPDPGLRREGA